MNRHEIITIPIANAQKANSKKHIPERRKEGREARRKGKEGRKERNKKGRKQASKQLSNGDFRYGSEQDL